MDTAFLIAAILLSLIIANGFYVLAEFSLAHAHRSRISQFAANGRRIAKLLEDILTESNRFDTYIATSQIAVIVSSLVLGFYARLTIIEHVSPRLAQEGWMPLMVAQGATTIVVILLLSLIQVVVGELIPKSLALRYTDEVALFTVVPLHSSVTFFKPAIWFFNTSAKLLLRIVRIPPATHWPALSPEEIEHLATESARSGLIEAGERQLLHNVLRVGAITASRVMVPRTRMVAASVDTPLPELLYLSSTSGRSRIPLYQDSIDNIVGSMHLKDLFRLHIADNINLDEVLRSVSYVTELQPALSVWNQLQQENNYIAIVLDEFGGTAGMITVADLLEEIFGEIQDETDEEPPLLAESNDGKTCLPGDMRIDDVNERFTLKLPEDDATTIGGLVMTKLGRIPQIGDEIFLDEVIIHVESVYEPSIIEVSLIFPSSDGKGESATETQTSEGS